MRRENILAGVVLLLAVAVTLLAYWAFTYEPEVVGAKAFELLDEEGNRRALLGISPEGTVALGFFDEDGCLRSSVGILPSGKPMIVMTEADGKVVWGAP